MEEKGPISALMVVGQYLLLEAYFILVFYNNGILNEYCYFRQI